MTLTANALHRLGGTRFVPRKKTENTTWLSLHVSGVVQEILARLARKEERSQSKMGEILLKEAMRARGEHVPEASEDDTQRQN